MSLPASPNLAPGSPQLQHIESARAVLERDARVLAAWIGGSIAAGTADRWSDVDLRLAVAESDLPDVMAAIPATLPAIHPVLGWFSRPVRGGHLVVVTFEGPLRADVEITTPAALRGLRHEAAASLIDPDGHVARFAGTPYTPRLLTPAELIEREAARVPIELGRLRQAIQDRSVLVATQAQAALLESAQRLLVLLRDPRAAGLAGPKHAADVLTSADVEPLLAPLRAWSAAWPDPAADSIDPTLEVLRPLAAEAGNRHGAPVPLRPEPPDPERAPAEASDVSRGARTAAGAVEAAHNLLVHAMVGASYYNRGLFTGLLWGYAMAAQLAADLARVRSDAPELSAKLAPADEAAFENALRPLRLGGVDAVRLVAANVAALYSRYLERACAALGLAYRRRLDREVNAYLFREGVFAYDVTAANPAP
ncbi:MAG: nucleotidyltransferase domain-containing protein [Chloroflexi bacterium]|nr:nucleotidyltransferase domain-containing protein [Chloroflexota bacterium]